MDVHDMYTFAIAKIAMVSPGGGRGGSIRARERSGGEGERPGGGGISWQA
jgi:hypothetical protein